MIDSSHRHTSSAIAVPHILETIQDECHDSPIPSYTIALDPLCKITFSLGEEFTHTVEVHEGMNAHGIAAEMCDRIGCEFEECVQEEVKRQLLDILQTGGNRQKDQIWKQKMTNVITGKPPNANDELFDDKIQDVEDQFSLQHVSFSTKSHKYFQTKLPDQLQIQSTKNLASNKHRQNYKSIYDRSQLKRKQTQQKLLKIKQQTEEGELKNCTFKPKVNQGSQWKNSKSIKKAKNQGSFFQEKVNNDKSKIPEDTCVVKEETYNQKDTFTRLYEQSFELRNKQREKLRSLENEQETKISNLSFIPEINDCSREICRMRSHASFLSNISSVQDQIYDCKEKKKSSALNNKSREKQNKNKKFTFHPEISENTKKMTKNLPPFIERLSISQKKPALKQSKSALNLKNPQNKNNDGAYKMKIKKQTYYIDDSLIVSTEEFEPEKTEKKNFPLVSPSNFRKNKQNHSKSRQDEDLQLNSPQTVNISAYLNNSNERTAEPLPTTNPKKKKDGIGKETAKRSKELHNQHKKGIFEVIFDYLSEEKPHSIADFSKKKQKQKTRTATQPEVSFASISLHPYLPSYVKEILDPMALELADCGLTLEKEEFVWAIERLYEGLNMSEKGSLMGWGVRLLPEESK